MNHGLAPSIIGDLEGLGRARPSPKVLTYSFSSHPLAASFSPKFTGFGAPSLNNYPNFQGRPTDNDSSMLILWKSKDHLLRPTNRLERARGVDDWIVFMDSEGLPFYLHPVSSFPSLASPC
jgi:hypothetical protein